MRKGILTFLITFTALTCYSQEKGGIMGRITDAELTDEPLLFAQVSLSDVNKTVQTNFHGNFELSNILPGNYILTVTYLGYETLRMPVTVIENEQTYIKQSLSVKKPGTNTPPLSETVSRLSSSE